MYCKKCRYISFDHFKACPKCGLDWQDEKKKLGIEWLGTGGRGWLESAPESEPADHAGTKAELSESLPSSADPEKAGVDPSRASSDRGHDTSGPEPDLDFDFTPEAAAYDEKDMEPDKEFEIEYPGLEINGTRDKKT